MFRRLKQQQIDRSRWDDCIKHAPQTKVYAFSEILDIVADQWEGWVIANGSRYEAVFPVPFKRKWGIKYSLPPKFCQQLGCFTHSGYQLAPEVFHKLMHQLPRHYYYGLLPCNDHNTRYLLPYLQDPACELRSNYKLNLQHNHQQLQSQYSSNHQRNIKKAHKQGVEIHQGTDLESFFTFLEPAVHPAGLHTEHFHLLRQLYQLKSTHAQPLLYFVYRNGQEPLGGAFFLETPVTLYYLIGGTSATGKTTGAMHALMDHVIGLYAGTDMWLDFEGSELPGVARFFQGFGAENVPYSTLKWNLIQHLFKG